MTGGTAYHAGVWSPWNHYFASIARKCKVPYVVSTRSMLDPWALNFQRWKKKIAWHAYAKRDLENAAWIHATSELEANNIRKSGLNASISVIPNGTIFPEESDRQIPKETTQRLLFLSRLHPKKGLENLIHAFGAINPPNWELIIAGNDENGYRLQLERIAETAYPACSIRFVGPVLDSEKWTLYRSADLFVLPSFSENFGLVIAEALACGVPVLTTRATPWSTLDEMGCGWCISTDRIALESTLKNILNNNREILEAMGQKGVPWMREAFSWEAQAKCFVQAVRSLNKC